jgi:hypothetical protein
MQSSASLVSMAISITSAIWANPPCSGRVLLVLLALANRARADGHCWPSVTVLARETNQSRRNIYHAIRTLEESDILHVEHSNGGHPTHYWIQLDKLTAKR